MKKPASKPRTEGTQLNGNQSHRVNLRNWIEREKRRDTGFRHAYDAVRQETLIARALVDLRRAKGISQKEIANRIGTSQQALSRLEHERYHGHTLRMLVRYADALGAQLEFRVGLKKAS